MIIETNDILVADTILEQYNKRLNNLLHILEDQKLSGPQMLKVAANIKKVRVERRKWQTMTFIINQVGVQNMKRLAECCSRQEKFLDDCHKQSAEHLKELMGE